jgi:hypothetical protein
MPNSVVVGRLRAVYPDHIVLGGNLHILIPRHFYMDGLEVGTSLTVVVQEENDQAHGGERPENSGSLAGNRRIPIVIRSAAEPVARPTARSV